MATILESLLAAPNATALNAKLKAAGSLRWLQQSGKLWQPMLTISPVQQVHLF